MSVEEGMKTSREGLPRVLVEVRDLSIGFERAAGGAPLVRGVDLSIRAGECVALVGESGSGKSLTARSLLGLAGAGARISATRFEIDGRDALGWRERDWRRVRGAFAGLVMQDALVSLDPLRTIGEEIAESLALHGGPRRRGEREARVLEAMRAVGIPEPERRARQHAHELSGGLRQRALIASAIAAAPSLLIADEPTTALDATVQAQVLAVLAERLRSGAALLLISHDLALVEGIADRVLVMHRGELVEQGVTREVLARPAHPYTRRLLAARPDAASRGYRLATARFDDEQGTSGKGGDQADMPGAPRSRIVRERLPVRPPVSSAHPVLQVDGIGKIYPQRGGAPFVALDQLSFSVAPGEVLGIVGESGSGKSTTANLVLGLLEPSAGEVRFLGSRWNGAGVREAARRALRPKLRYIPQDPLSAFDPRHTVRQLLDDGLHAAELDPVRRLARSVELLERVGLDAAMLERRPLTLSGGQRQRIAIARAVASEPALIVCDEPVSALDVQVQAQVLDLLAELQARLGVALIFISHDLDVIRHVSDRVLVMKEGRVVEAGESGAVFDAPRAAYTRQLLAASPSWRREMGEPVAA